MFPELTKPLCLIAVMLVADVLFLASADLPQPRARVCTVVIKDVVYMIGGATTGTLFYDEAWKLDLTKGVDIEKPNWQPIKAMGRGVAYPACASNNDDTIWVFGGYGNKTIPNNQLHKYNVVKDEWTNLTNSQVDRPPVRARAHGLYKDGIFMTMLGREGEHKSPEWSKTVYTLKTWNMRWTARYVENSPSKRDSYTLTQVDDNVAVLLGGLSPKGPLRSMDEVSIFNLNTWRWMDLKAQGQIPPNMGAHNAVACK
jgi:hypothetical protein